MFWHAGNSLDSWTYLWATVGIWVFSLCGRFLAKIKTPGLRGAVASLEDIDGELLKITIPAFGGLTWHPGQHVFLRFPSIAPLDNHPFTIASVSDATYVTGKDGENTRTPLTFFVRPREGITKKLMKITQRNLTRKLKVVIEGPYGGHDRHLELAYESVVLVAGGSGITSVLPLLTHLSRMIGRERIVLREIKLVWAVRDKQAITWIRKELGDAIAAAPGSVTIDYYVTSEGTTSETSSLDLENTGHGVRDAISSEKMVEVHQPKHDIGPGTFGRPDLKSLIPITLTQERTFVIGKGYAVSRTNKANVR
jgi:predicted ferric reductase